MVQCKAVQLFEIIKNKPLFAQFEQTRQLTNEQMEERRVVEYHHPGTIADQDTREFIDWLEKEIIMLRQGLNINE
jgi:hypothetical protein